MSLILSKILALEGWIHEDRKATQATESDQKQDSHHKHVWNQKQDMDDDDYDDDDDNCDDDNCNHWAKYHMKWSS
jgi:hypothetical protein